MAARRFAWVIVAAATAGFAVVAHATNLPISPGPLGAGAATVTSCDSSGVDFRYALNSAGSVTSVTVANIDEGCQGGTLRVTLTNGGADVGTGSMLLPSSGWTGSYAVSISPTPLSSLVTATYAAIEGP